MKINLKKAVTIGMALSISLSMLAGCSSEEGSKESVADTSAAKVSQADDTAAGKEVKSEIEWISTYNGPDKKDDRMFGAAVASDGSYIAVGNSENADKSETAVYLKYKADGTQEWAKQIPDTHLQAVIETKSGYLAVGSTTSKAEPFFKETAAAAGEPDTNAAAVLFDKEGNIIWAKSFGGSGYDVFTGHMWSGSGYPSVLPNGNFLLLGNTASNDGDFKGRNIGGTDGFLLEIDPQGKLVSVNLYGGSGNDTLHEAIALEDGSILIGGIMNLPTEEKTKKVLPADGMFKGLSDNWDEGSVFVTKLDKNKNILWTKLINAHGPWVVGMTPAKDGGIMVAADGMKETAEEEATSLSLYKLDANGNVIWEKDYSNDKGDTARIFVTSLRGAADGTYLLSGEVHYKSVLEPDSEGMRGWLGCIDETGNLLWERNFEGTDYELHIHAEPAADGGVVLAAQKASEDGDWDAVLIKYAPYVKSK
ncbi:hypothetical protein LY28_01080 [Ruminiclostridium sufflavum DSM 19573]|uniref:Uncharacterized protein n=1 Tax=Ruminiclostridium sufflavum DSM 19573 TaxID=1121337 RepID=A0A318XRH5_9FIRM|nr:hypothetical protein [Ruminiclostridium sufflavum]PYG88726.1 hypothetical protein LY28_01080 [Ruminiclostridium sufflavum DSM 19573]